MENDFGELATMAIKIGFGDLAAIMIEIDIEDFKCHGDGNRHWGLIRHCECQFLMPWPLSPQCRFQLLWPLSQQYRFQSPSPPNAVR